MLSRLRYHWICFTQQKPPSHVLDVKFRELLARLLSLMAPQRAEGVKKKRYGSRFDGGYVMLDDFNGIKGALSLGIGGNVKWDLAMAEKGLTLWQYDHTVGGPPVQHPNFVFNKARIGIEAENTTPSTTLPALIAEHPGDEMILKMDIEGSEWEVFAHIDPEYLKAFRQIVIEFHDFEKIADPAWREQAMTALEHLGQNHSVVHVHGNNFVALVVAGDISIPNCLELTYVRKDAYRLVPTNETFPGAVDRPSNPFRPEVQLGTFTYS